MELRSIGSLKVSAVGIGCNNFGMRIDEQESAAVVRAALDAGVNLFDTADVYGGTRSEEYLGARSASRRDEAVIATKFGARIDRERQGASATYVRRAVEDSLRRLGTDRIDLYQLHVPDAPRRSTRRSARSTSSSGTGKVREIGASNFTAEMIDEAEAVSREHGWARFVSVQNEYSLLRRLPETGVLDACVRHRIGFLPYFPLASGMLTGKYRRNESPPEGTRLASMPRRATGTGVQPRRTSTGSRRSKHGRASAVTRCSSSRSRGCSRDRRSPASSPARRIPNRSRANVAAATWSLTEPTISPRSTSCLERAKG